MTHHSLQFVGGLHRSAAGAIALLAICLLPLSAFAQQPTNEASSIVRLQAPAAADVQQAQQTLRATPISDELAQARQHTAQAERELGSMIKRMALRKEAAIAFAKAGKWRDALQACDLLTSEFNLPYAATRGEVLMQLPSPTTTDTADQISPERLQLLCLDTIDGCILEDQYGWAGLLVMRASELEQKLGPIAGRPRTEEFKQRIDELLPLYVGKVEAAKNTLQNLPLDAAANETLGKFYAFDKRDWEAALPHLALGNHTVLKSLAVAELAEAKNEAAQVSLAMKYDRAAASVADTRLSTYLRQRAAYWKGVVKLQHVASARRAGAPFPGVNTEELSTNVPSVDNLPLRRIPPDGAAVMLTFDPRSINVSLPQTIDVSLENGRRSQGNRAVIYDASVRGNHFEGLRIASSSGDFVGPAWHSDGAPLVAPRRIFGGLSGYTWTGWIRPHNQPQTGFAFAETAAPNFRADNKSPELEFDGRLFRFHGARHWFDEQPIRSAYFLQTDPAPEWTFVAVTVSPGQRLRVTWNDITKEAPLAAGRSTIGGSALLGALAASFDEIAMYPRPLSEAEVKAIYHYGLYGLPLAEYRPQNEPFTPLFYRPRDLAGGPPIPNENNVPTNITPSPAAPPAVAKRARPTDEEWKEAKKQVKELFAKDVDKADTGEKRRQLAKKMQEVARDTNDPPAARYALFYEAATMLTNFDSPDAWDAWNMLSKDFEGSFHDEKADVLDRLLKKARQPSEHKLLADRYVTLLNEALREDDYKSADLLASRAETCVKKAGDKVLERMVSQGAKDLAQMRAAFNAAKGAQATLTASPDDAAANLQWGKYLTFYRNEWPEGLKLLVKGGEDPLALLAKQDIAGASSPAAQQELGDAWWTEADKLGDERRAQRSVRGRAVHWYRQALPQLTGLTSAKVTKRVETYQSETSPIPVSTPFDALSMIDTTTHSTSADWIRQGAAIGFTPRSGSSYNRLMVPVGIHGSYEMQTRIEWLGAFGGDVVIQLPVGDRMVEASYGRSPELRLGDPLARAKIEQGGADFQRGKTYVLGAKVTLEGDNATVLATINGRPYMSWTGPISQTSSIDMVRTRSSRLRASNALGDALMQPVVTIQGGFSESFAISGLQLEVQSGWAEPIMR